MLGNDVVDLRDPDTRPETYRPRFDARVFDPVELREIERDETPHARRWAHWAAKEAAYKLARQIEPSFVFSPSNLVVRFEPAQRRAMDRFERFGVVRLSSALAAGIREIEVRSFESPASVHAMALPSGADWDAVTSAVEEIPPDTNASKAVRLLARDRVAGDLGIDVNRVSIGRRGRIPTVEIDGARSTLSISLSHHGRWVACAMSLRCESFLRDETPVSRRSGGEEGRVMSTELGSAAGTS